MFTHKSNDAWNAMTVGLIEAGFNIARAVQSDVSNLLDYGLNTVDIYTAYFGTALKVVSENWGAKRSTANPDRPEDPFGVRPEDALAVARQQVVDFRARQIFNGQQQILSDPLTRFYILAQDGAGDAVMPFDEANLFARAIGVDLAGDQAKRIMSLKDGKATLKSAADRWSERLISADRPAVTPLDQAHTAIAIAARQNAAAAQHWLEFNGHRHQEAEFRTTLAALQKIQKPGHPDEQGTQALQALLYGEEKPRQEHFAEIVTIDG